MARVKWPLGWDGPPTESGFPRPKCAEKWFEYNGMIQKQCDLPVTQSGLMVSGHEGPHASKASAESITARQDWLETDKGKKWWAKFGYEPTESGDVYMEGQWFEK